MKLLATVVTALRCLGVIETAAWVEINRRDELMKNAFSLPQNEQTDNALRSTKANGNTDLPVIFRLDPNRVQLKNRKNVRANRHLTVFLSWDALYCER